MIRVTNLCRTLGALGALVGLVAGIPTALSVGIGWSLPRRIPSLDELGRGLGGGAMSDAVVVGILATVLWLAWAMFVACVAVEVVAALRGHQARIPLAGTFARWLLASLAVVSSVVAGLRPALAEAVPGYAVAATAFDHHVAHTASMEMAHAPAAGAPVAWTPPAPPASPSPPPPAAEDGTYLVVRPDDTLWDIAEETLGDPYRWPELFELNAGREQPDGRWLRKPDLIRPGWRIALPADAVLTRTPEADPAEASPSPVSGLTTADARQVPPPASPQEASPATTPAPSPAAGSESVAVAPARGAAASTSTSTSAAPAETQSRRVPDPVLLGRDAMRLASALALGLPLFAAAGIAVRLNQRRRIQVARHRPGRDIVRPDPALEPLERRIRAIAADEASEWVDVALRVLGAELRHWSLALPRVTLVRAGELGLEVALAEPMAQAPPSFTAVDDGHVWRLDPELELAELQHRAGDHVAPFPAMVSVGLSPEGPVLVDLETLGVLSVEGDAARVSALLAGAAVELASAPWAERIDLRLMGAPPSLESVEGVTVVEELGSLRQHLITTAAGVSDALGVRSSTLAARLDEPGEAWLPTVAVVDTPTPAEGLAELARRVGGGRGVAVVALGPIEGASWRLSVVREGFARLEGPLGIDVGHLRATGDIGRWAESTAEPVVETDVGHLDQGAIAGAAALLSAASHDHDVATPVELGAEAPRVRPRPRREHHDVWVDVLGPVKVTGWAEPVGRRRKLEELVVYLATHDDPVPAERIRCAVWPDTEVKTKSFIQAVSRARRHLGGPAYLPEAAHGAYHRGAGVGCSWIRFKELAAAACAAARSDPDEAMALWRQALSLVRGEPFAGVAKGSYVWAWSPGPGPTVYNMQVAITRAADTLGTLALAHDDPDTALWATRQGLLAMPEQLSLFDWEMRVAAHRRDRAALDAAYRARRRAQETMDPFGGVSPECVKLYEELVAAMRQRSG